MKLKTLKKNYEFKRVLNKGTYLHGKYMEVVVLNNRSKQNSIGIAVGVKTAKAVKRNRIKRLIRENYRLMQEDFKKGYNIIFLWKKKANMQEVTFHLIQKDMIKIQKEIEKL